MRLEELARVVAPVAYAVIGSAALVGAVVGAIIGDRVYRLAIKRNRHGQ